jgi:GntR family transcriptional regulator, transcriptional repressor for pyruvate dehydrogenase complex
VDRDLPDRLEPSGLRARARGGDSSPRPAVRRVRKAYEQVADDLRELILSGELRAGERLPSEAELATEFAVSRTTVREALRVLSTQHLIRTVRGTRGGSFVMLPSLESISDLYDANINLLAESRHLSLEEFIESRELFDVAAARLAAVRCSEEDLEKLRSTLPDDFGGPAPKIQWRRNRSFHSLLIAAAGNTLLYIASKPVYSVLETHLSLLALPSRFHHTIHEQHRLILDAIEQGDSDAAAERMREHLAFLRPYYHQAWNEPSATS